IGHKNFGTKGLRTFLGPLVTFALRFGCLNIDKRKVRGYTGNADPHRAENGPDFRSRPLPSPTTPSSRARRAERIVPPSADLRPAWPLGFDRPRSRGGIPFCRTRRRRAWKILVFSGLVQCPGCVREAGSRHP